MSYPRFQVLLEAGIMWRTRDQQLAMSAAAFPHMDEKGQREMQERLSRSLRRAEEDVVEDNTQALQQLRDRARLMAALGR